MLRTEIGKSSSAPRESQVRLWVVLDLNSNKRGSLEQQLVSLAERLKGVQATFVFDRQVPAWLNAALKQRNIETRTLNFRQPLAAFVEFSRWIARERPSLVHFHFVRAYSPLVIAARAFGARVLIHDHITLGEPVIAARAHGQGTKKLLRILKRARAMAMNRLVELRIPVSSFVAQSVRDAEFVSASRVAVVENGVDVERFALSERDAFRREEKLGTAPTVACVSRMSPEKGVDVLIESFAQIKDQQAVLLIVGDGPDADRCKSLSRQLGVEHRVRFLGLRNDVERIFNAADVVVVPSLWQEAFGLVVVEAMATGTPVVVTDSGAMPEIVDYGKCGIVVPKRDPAAMATAIERLLLSPAEASALGERGRTRALVHYTVDRWADRIRSIYARFLPFQVDKEGRKLDLTNDVLTRFAETRVPDNISQASIAAS